MYSFLRGEMIRKKISILELAKEIGVTEKTLRNKLSGNTDFTWPEALAVRKIINPDMDLDTLFVSDEDKNKI